MWRLSALALPLAWPPGAQTPPTQARADAIRPNCRRDVLTNGSSVPPGGKPALDCLRANLSKLSPARGTAVAAVN